MPRRRHRCAPLLFLLALLLPAAAPRPAHARGEPGPIAAARKDLLEHLHAIADLCTARKLFGSRYDVYELILTFDPDDTAARKWNGYERLGDGSWSEQGRKRPHNLMASGLPALRALQAETAAWYVTRIGEAAAKLPPGMAEAWRARAVAEAVRIAPEDAAMREQAGEVRGKGADGKPGWILVETQRSRVRRPMLRKAAERALKQVPKAKPGRVLPGEKSSTVQWTTALQGSLARLTGTTAPAELAHVLRNAEAAILFFRAAFDRTPPAMPGLVLHVLDNPATGELYLGDQPGVSGDFVKFSTQLAALWIPHSSRVLIKSPDAVIRLEAGARQVNGAMMRSVFGVTSRMGWATHGFGLYLTWQVTGTRRLNAVRRSQYGERKEKADFADRLQAEGADWLAEARTLVAGKDVPDLRLLLGKTVNTMSAEEVLYSYVFTQFLVEGHHEDLGAFLPALAGVKDAEYDLPFVQYLGFDVVTAQERLARWLQEAR